MKRLSFIIVALVAIQSFGQLVNTVPASGSVGIGTDSPDPAYQLTVNGNAKMLNTLGIDGDMIIEGQSILNTVVRMPGLAAYAGEINDFQILVTDPYGNVTKITRGDLVNGISSLPEGIDGCTPEATESPQWYNAPYKLFTVCPDIKVGIGTINPDFLLHVKGKAYAMQMKIGNKDAISEALISGFSVSGSQDLIELGTMLGGGAEEVRFKITNDGTVYAREIRIRLTTDFPDYVFEDEYKLMSLNDLAEFVKENKHLPNIPSAKDVEDDGLDLANMQVRMVEKIEELTLYSIQLNEENQRLENELISLQKEVEAIKNMIRK